MSVQKKKRYRTRAERVLGVMFEMGGREFCIEDVKLFIGAPNGGGGVAVPPPNRNFKNAFCRHDDVKSCT